MSKANLSLVGLAKFEGRSTYHPPHSAGDEGLIIMRHRTYEEAVEAAGVIELPDGHEPAPRDSQLSDPFADGYENEDPPGGPR